MTYLNYTNEEINNYWIRYIGLRNKGLKKQANKELNKLVEYINSLCIKVKEEFVHYICREKFDKGKDITFQYPLVKKVIMPILLPSIKLKIMPQIRWLYQLQYVDNECEQLIMKEVKSRENLLEIAHTIDKNDLITVKLLVNSYLNNLYYGSHHLPDFILIEEDVVETYKEKLSRIFSYYQESHVINNGMKEDLAYYSTLYKDYFSFTRDSHNDTFTKWCVNNNRSYSWVKSYYYTKK